jgi:hypothetical protein
MDTSDFHLPRVRSNRKFRVDYSFSSTYERSEKHGNHLPEMEVGGRLPEREYAERSVQGKGLCGDAGGHFAFWGKQHLFL